MCAAPTARHRQAARRHPADPMSGLGKGHDAAAHSKAPQRQPALPPPGRNSGHRPCDNSDDSSDSDFVRLSKPRRQPAKPAAQPAAAGKRATAAGKHAPPAPQARAQQAPAAANQRHQQQLPRGAAAAAKPQQALLRQQAGGSQQPQRQHPPPAATLQQREQHPPAGNPLQPPARRPAHGAVSGGSRQAVQGAVGGGGRPPKPSAAPAQKRKGQAASGAGAGVSKKAKAAQPPPRWAEGAADADNSSSGDDDFVPGSLRPVLLPTVPLEVAPRAAPPRKRQADGGGRGGGRSGQGGGMAAVDPGFGERVAVIRLDSLELARWPGEAAWRQRVEQLDMLHATDAPARMPSLNFTSCPPCVESAGWQASTAGIRRVAPWQPSSSALATGARCGGGAASGARVISTPSLLSYDLSQLGGSFQGVLLQLHALGGGGRSGRTSRDGVAQPGAPAGGSGRTSGSPSWEQLEALQLGDDVVANGLLFVWASKAAVAPAVRWMARRGFKLVENLMWVLLGANGAPLQVRCGRVRGRRLGGREVLGWEQAHVTHGGGAAHAACHRSLLLTLLNPLSVTGHNAPRLPHHHRSCTLRCSAARTRRCWLGGGATRRSSTWSCATSARPTSLPRRRCARGRSPTRVGLLGLKGWQ